MLKKDLCLLRSSQFADVLKLFGSGRQVSGRRFFAVLLSLLLVFQLAVPCFAQETAAELNYSGYRIEEFVNNEILAVYKDGDSQVFSCGSEDQLKTRLLELAEDSSVSFVQPNFEYKTDAASTAAVNDEFFSEQWALKNDGSFKMETENNDFPVYDDPFGIPAVPGHWINPWPWLEERFFFGWFSASSISSSESESQNTEISSVTAAANKSATVISSVSGIDIKAEDAWSLYDGAERQTVIALIDTGVDTSHEDFGDVFWKNEGEIPGNGIDDDGNGYVDDVNGWNFYSNNNVIYVGSEDNHGTHGAGSIAASSGNSTGISGIIRDGSVKIMVIKALGGKDGSGTTESVRKAIKYAEANGADICNLSMGASDYDRALYQVMAQSNMLFVVSAGNDGTDNDQTACYPASFPLNNIVSVANLQPDGTLCLSSNYGAESVDIAVPGSYILGLTTDDSYSYMTGTSMSAPIFSAAAAMLHSYRSDLALSDVKRILLETSSPLDSLQGKVVSGGMLNLGSAMEYAQQYEVSAQSSALPFTDVLKENSAYTAIKYLYENNIMVGTSQTTFSPDAGLTRAMAVTLLGRLAEAEQKDTDTFSDVVNGTWYSGYVGWAAANRIVVGYGNGLFGTEDSVTAEQMDLILGRYAALLGQEYDSGLSGQYALTRGQTAQALYDFCQNILGAE